MADEFRSQETKAPFNMAISTLEALRSILADIKKMESEFNPFLDEGTKQKIIINLVKRFYVDASPLLEPAVVEKYKGILELEPVKVEGIDGGGKLTKRTRVLFSYELEKKLNEYLLGLQRELQKEKYFMPPKRDLGKAVGSFGP